MKGRSCLDWQQQREPDEGGLAWTGDNKGNMTGIHDEGSVIDGHRIENGGNNKQAASPVSCGSA